MENNIIENINIKWHRRYLDLAKLVSTWSKDPSTKCGAYISTFDNKPVSHGYNGFPPKVDDNKEERFIRETKYKWTIHAELNAIITAERNLDNCIMYVTTYMCSNCTACALRSGLRNFVIGNDDLLTNGRWTESINISKEMLIETNSNYYMLNNNDELINLLNI